MSEILKVVDLNYKYKKNEKYALKNVNFSVQPGDFIALIGSNGSGKSTLMNNLTGFLKPTSGTVEYFETGFKNYSQKQPFSAIGYSPQIQMMDWFSNVFDNVMLESLLFGNSIKKSKELSNIALKKVNLDSASSKKKLPETLSGGQQQRVQLARAVVHNPDFLILDEPTVGLDVESAELFLTNVKKSGVTALVSSHDINILEKYANKLLFIDNGEIIYFGGLKEFIQKYNQQAYKGIYFKTDDRDKIEAELKQQGLEFEVDEGSIIVNDDILNPVIQIITKYGQIESISDFQKSLLDIYYEMKVSQ